VGELGEGLIFTLLGWRNQIDEGINANRCGSKMKTDPKAPFDDFS
jgi:hypothetical protein